MFAPAILTKKSMMAIVIDAVEEGRCNVQAPDPQQVRRYWFTGEMPLLTLGLR
jgi:hypothetical protein